MNILFGGGSDEGWKQQREMFSLMNHIPTVVERISRTYYMRIESRLITYSDKNPCLFNLFFVLCNRPNKENDYDILKREDYTLSFPALVLHQNITTEWPLRMNGEIYSCPKEDEFKKEGILFYKKDHYAIKHINEHLIYADILNPELQNKTEKDIKKIILADIINYVKRLYDTEDFYYMMSLFDERSPYSSYSNKELKGIVKLLKNNPQILKLVSIIADDQLQERIVPFLLKSKINIKENEPSELLSKVILQIEKWYKGQDVGYVDRLVNDLKNYKQDIDNGIATTTLQKCLLSAKLESSLKDSTIEKRLKI